MSGEPSGRVFRNSGVMGVRERPMLDLANELAIPRWQRAQAAASHVAVLIGRFRRDRRRVGSLCRRTLAECTAQSRGEHKSSQDEQAIEEP